MAQQEYLLQYKTETIICGFPESEFEQSQTIKGWKIFDEVNKTDWIEKGAQLNEYRIVLEKRVQVLKSKDAQMKLLYELQDEAFSIIDDLKLVWTYAFGGIYKSYKANEGINAPKDWTTNSGEILDEMHPSQYKIETSIDTETWFVAPFRPLNRLLIAYNGYKESDNHLTYLIQFYNDARIAHIEASLLIYAKALEILDSALKGNSKKQKTENLPESIKSDLTQDLNWLFNMANNRVNGRHAIRNKEEIRFHPEMTNDEMRDFIYNASIMIEWYITDALGMTFHKREWGNKYVIGENRKL